MGTLAPWGEHSTQRPAMDDANTQSNNRKSHWRRVREAPKTLCIADGREGDVYAGSVQRDTSLVNHDLDTQEIFCFVRDKGWL